MITRFGVRYLKGVREAEINIRPITILIGANGSGKSTIPQALVLLRQALDRDQLSANGDLINLGSIRDLFFNHNIEEPIQFYLEGKKNGVVYSEDVRFHANGVDSCRFSLDTAYLKLKTYYDRSTSTEYVRPEKIEKRRFSINLRNSHRFSDPVEISGTSVQGKGAEKKLKELSDVFRQDSSIINTELSRIWYISPIRGISEPFYEISDYPMNKPDLSSVRTMSEKNSSWLSTLAYKPELMTIVSNWCRYILDTGLMHELVPGKKVTLRSIQKNDNNKINLINEGFGLNQLSYMLTQLALTEKESILAIDEPEIHLHPAAQIRLMNTLIEEAVSREITLIIVTHSENVVYQALTKVGKKELQPDQLSLYHFQKTEKGCIAKEIEFDERGRLKKGLPDFFEVNVKQYKQYMDILLGEGEKNE